MGIVKVGIITFFLMGSLEVSHAVPSNSSSPKAVAAKKAAEEKVAAAKKAAEEKAEAARKAAEEKFNKMTPYEKALAEAKAEDKVNAAELFDVTFDLGPVGQVLRDDVLRKDKAGKAAQFQVGFDSYHGKSFGQYIQINGDSVVAKDHKRFHLVLKSNMLPAGLETLYSCQEKAINSLVDGKSLRVVAKSVHRHRLFVTEVEMLRAYGYERYMARQLKKKARNSFPNYKKFMESIQDLLVPRTGVLLYPDKISLQCE